MSDDTNRNELRDLARNLAFKGSPKKEWLGGKLQECMVLVDEDEGLQFTAAVESEAVGILDIKNKDTFASWGKDGQAVRKHFYRYDGPARVNDVATEYLSPNLNLLAAIRELPTSEVIATLGKVAFPWEIKNGRWFRRDITGKKVCKGQRNDRECAQADASLVEQGWTVIDPRK